MMLAHSYTPDIDPTGWLMSEKMDGIRAYWDGVELKSRLGNKIYAPKWFTDELPKDLHLDGELWGGRNNFQRTISIVRSQSKDAEWRFVSYWVFDAPNAPGGFAERLDTAGASICMSDNAFMVPHAVCEGQEHLMERLSALVSSGAEGIMLRKPDSPYENKRSHFLLKCKQMHDAEGVVIGHKTGAGKHSKRLGALLVRTEDGHEFGVGTGLSDAERENPPSIGTVITYRYQELTKDGIPRFPVFIRIREDV